LLLAPALAAADAAVRAREGEINHWIEYYQRERQPLPPAAQGVPRQGPARAEGAATGKDPKR
jgi:hypothetical protein